MTASSDTPSPLDALRCARAERATVIRRRGMPIGFAVAVLVGVTAWRASPHPGVHGASLIIAVAVCCFLATMITLVWFGIPFSGVPSPRARLRPYLPVATLLFASSVTLQVLQPGGPAFVGLFLTVSIAARMIPARHSALLLAVCLAFLAGFVLTGVTGWRGGSGVVGMLAMVAIYVMSLFARRIREAEDQEEQLLAELEASRTAELRAVALAERQRLAREVHDVLAHSLSGLAVHLEGARMLAVNSPGDERLPAVIDHAHQLARSGLDEARQAIGMLRGEDLPSLERLAEIFEADSGVPCSFTSVGPSRDLDPEVRLALYRVTQEALTNVRKHAHPDRVEVRLAYLPDAVTLTVTDFGAGPQTVGVAEGGQDKAIEGYGVTGMRERAGLLGGTLDAAPTPDGFRVTLRVPMGPR